LGLLEDLKKTILLGIFLCLSASGILIFAPIIHAQQQQGQQEVRSCQNTEENIRNDAILAIIASAVAGGTFRGENISFICVGENIIILRFDYVLTTKNNEANWGWSAIDMLINQKNYTLTQIMPYETNLNQTVIKHHVAVLTK
jgi:hypothetical protein